MLADMIRTEDIDDQIESALQLLDMIRDVRSAISRLPIGTGAHQDGVLGESERLGAEPERSIFFDDQIALAKRGQDRVDQSRVQQIEFVGINVEADFQTLASPPDVAHDGFHSRRAEYFKLGDVD